MILLSPTDLPNLPKRIVSLVPSQTELLYDLGLEAETVGITKFCVHPKSWFISKEKIGGTKTVNIKKIKRLKPDLIIANKEENVKEQIEALAAFYPVWVSDVKNFTDALQMIADIGSLTGKLAAVNTLINQINKVFDELPAMAKPVKTAYLIWRDPYMAVGGDTFINDMLSKCSFKNIFSDKTRYPQVNIAQLQTAGCQLLLLSTEPYPFKQKHIDELSKQLPGTKIILADGELFSWYGSRMLQSVAYFKELVTKILS